MIPQYKILVENLTVEYNSNKMHQTVISNMSFEVTNNMTFAILGTNGSGKTTLLNSIAKLIKPTSGSTSIISFPTMENNLDITVALLNQDYRQTNYPWASAIENITFPLKFKKINKRKRFEIGKEILNEIIPEVNPVKKVYNLSGGQQQLIAIARAIISEPDVILADEPLSAADTIHTMQAIKAIERIREERKFPMIWISHQIDEALLLGDTIGLLSKKSHGFSRIIENPLGRPRNLIDLTNAEIVKLKAEIIDFLIIDDKN